VLWEVQMDRGALEQRFAEIEAKIVDVQHQIGEQREVIAKLKSASRPTDHAKYLLAGLELLQAAHRDKRNAMLGELSRFQTEPSSRMKPDP